MASRLYSWARWVVRHRKSVTAVWLLLLAAVAALAVTLPGKTSNEFTVPGVESQQAQDLLRQEFPQASGAQARIVFAAPGSEKVTGSRYAPGIEATLKEAARIPGVVAVSDPAATGTVSADGTIAYADVTFSDPVADLDESAREQVEQAGSAARDTGLRVEFGGTAMAPPTEIGGVAEVIGVVVAVVVLAVTLGSLIAAGLPLLTAAVGVGIGVLGVMFVSRFVELTGTATVLAVMLGLAVGIDYALFIIARHREQLADDDQDVEDSIARAVATAGSAVVFAGATVIIALVALCATGIPFLNAMGLAAAVTVLLAVLIAVSLVPALLAFAGARLRPRRKAADGPRGPRREPGAWGMRWGRLVTRRPLVTLAVGTIALLAVAVPALDLRLGLPGNSARPAESTQHKSYDLLSEGFGPGFNATLAAVVDARDIPADRRAATLEALRGDLAGQRGVAAVAPPAANADKTVYLIGVVPATGPDDAATTDLVHRMRDADAATVAQAGGTLYIAGTTASTIDVSDKISDALPLFVAIIVLLALVLLTAAFRSLLVPLKAVVGFLLSVAAAIGASVWVFQDGHLSGPLSVAAAAPIACFLPVLLIGVLFGLAMDYEVFLVSRMREHYEHTGDAEEAVVHGMARSGRVVCAAALIMTAVFAGFIFNHDPIIKSIGFALAFGVAVDAFVVRMTLVPAALALLGDRAWKLPARLDRRIPHIDIEGARLPARTPAAPAVAEPAAAESRTG
ncbi:MMPL family transporter [Streptomyces sp. CRN 30]|uniref:MMPL family transporter n=1 Tax=Streptomyces sp. CRN 30 TaxID=3075613 RepID=UPI002A7EE716|nr:MMPL family transporter [Streptomyces sp. CRN 30]